MPDMERMEEIKTLLMELDYKMKEVELVRDRLKNIFNIGAPSLRKKPARRPQDIVKRVMG